MSGEYEHDVTGGLGRFDSFAAFAHSLQLLRTNTPERAAALVSERMQQIAAANAKAAVAVTAANAESASAAASSLRFGCSDWTASSVFFALLLLLAILQSLWFLAQRLWLCRLHQLQRHASGGGVGADPRRIDKTGQSTMQWLSFLAPSPTLPQPAVPHLALAPSQQSQAQAQQRAPILFGMVLGVISLLLVQWMASPAVMHAMWGSRGSAPASGSSTTNSMVLSTTSDPSGSVVATTITPACPICPPVRACPVPTCPPRKCPQPDAAAPATALVAAASQASCPTCYRLTDLPSSAPTPLFMQSSWTAFPVRAVDCADYDSAGRWVPRPAFQPDNKESWPAYTKVDQFMQYGSEPNAVNLAHVYEPPLSCLVHTKAADGSEKLQSSFRRFDAQKFLRALSGRTISFLGDSLVRQQFGQLISQLDAEKLGSNWFYPPRARFLDAVREVYFTHNVTIKNQWIMGHNSAHSARDEVFPTLWRSDLLIFNIGAFFHDDADAHSKFTEALERFLGWTQEHYRGSVIWREYAPTHFDTRDGEFSMGAEHRGGRSGELPSCKGYSPGDAALSEEDHKAHYTNYRLLLGNEIMQKAGVPIMRVWNQSLTQPQGDQQHPGRGDCRHFMAKSSVLEHWTDVLYNMIVPPDME